jgi:hypothetical protein
MAFLLLLALLPSALSLSPSAPVELWTAYTGWPTCYRQPLLLRTLTHLLVFVEGRPGIPYCSGTFWPDVQDFPILVRASSDDGSSFGAAVNITRGSLDFLVAVHDEQTDAVLLLVQQGDSGTILLRGSGDGSSWSAPQPLNISQPGFASLIPGVGHGLQVSPRFCLDPSCSGLAGRLLVPFVATLVGPVSNDTACGTCATALLSSDDHGESWQLAAVSEQNGSREAALVQLDSAAFSTLGAVIYAAERNLGNTTGSRWHAVSTNGGRSFSQYGLDPALPDVVTGNWTGVVAGAARFDSASSSSSSPVLVFTAPSAAAQRANLTLWLSADQGQSWSAPALSLWPGPAAYSDALQINSTHMGIVWEGGSQEFAQGIFFSAVQM